MADLTEAAKRICRGARTRRRSFVAFVGVQVVHWGAEAGDALLYASAALLAAVVFRFSTIPLYRQWAELALGPYLLAAVVSAVATRVRRNRFEREYEAFLSDGAGPGGIARSPRAARHWDPLRTWVFVFVLVGATLLPLSMEVAWRAQSNPSSANPTAHVQPEALVVEQAAHRAAHGQDPYRLVTVHGRVVVRAPAGEPTSDTFFPYLPLMTLFGLPRSTREPLVMTDARIFFSMVTILVTAAALMLSRGPNEPKFRTLQVLTVLPTAALPLATGGDDMPIVALLLLAMVLAQRRKPGWSGFVLGVVSAMKFTAWPLAALALFAARDARGRRAPIRMVLGMLVVAGPVVVPFVLRNAAAFAENVILFPLGLSGVSSPAASALPGHILVSFFPSLHRILPAVAGVGGLGWLGMHLVRRRPTTASKVTALAGWVTLVGFLVAPATRIGYMLYPINFFVWSSLLREPGRGPAEALLEPDSLAVPSLA